MGTDPDHDDGVFKKPLKGSFKRVGEHMAEEMKSKTPTEAVRDDLGGSSEPEPEER